MESTAQGVGNTFHRRWLSAERGDSGYTPLFFSWLEDPIYAVEHVTWEDIGPLDDEEDALKVTLGASPGQLQWRREIIRTEFDGDLDGFHQEYPSTPTEAFITSGRQYFQPQYISRFHPVEPIRRARLTGGWVKGQEIMAERDDRGPLWVYEKKNPEHRYVMFIDPAGVVGELRAKNFSDPSDVSDFTAMWVVDATTMATVAVWHARIDLGKIALEAAKLGRIYNNAVVCVETTGGSGGLIIEMMRELGYSALHRDRSRDTYDRARSNRYGWSTTTATRPTMLETLRDVLREDPHLLRHAPLHQEMLTFIIGRARPEAAPGTHDDLIFAAAGCYTIAGEYAQRKPIRLVGAKLKKQRKRPRSFEDVLMRARH